LRPFKPGSDYFSDFAFLRKRFSFEFFRSAILLFCSRSTARGNPPLRNPPLQQTQGYVILMQYVESKENFARFGPGNLDGRLLKHQ
jgi:hypothetical protein